jgi:hypothetical protein
MATDEPGSHVLKPCGLSHDAEAPSSYPLENQVIRRPQDAHVLANPLELDPLRISPYDGTLTWPLKCYDDGAPAGNFI